MYMYRGWLIIYDEEEFSYARYQATQYGVHISNSTLTELKNSIDRKLEERYGVV